MEAQEVQCETFALSSEALPDIQDMMKAGDPQELESVYREAGLDTLADNVEPLRRARVAELRYMELPGTDYALYAKFLSEKIRLERCVIPPPDEALMALAAAKKQKSFDDYIILANPATGESLLLGYIDVGYDRRYFKLAHWGYALTTVEELRKPRQSDRWVGIGSAFRRLRPGTKTKKLPGPLHFAVVTALAAMPCWYFLLPISWWLFAVALAGAMTLCGYYTAQRTSFASSERMVAGWAIAFNAVAALVIGAINLNAWATNDRTEDVLVCGVHISKVDGKAWIIETSEGNRNVEGGFYNGTYYPIGHKTAAQSLVGNWVRLTEHGHSFGDDDNGPFVTRAQTLRKGSCGNL